MIDKTFDLLLFGRHSRTIEIEELRAIETDAMRAGVSGLDQVVGLVEVAPSAERLAARYWPGALTLVLPLRRPDLVPDAVSGGRGTLGLRIPDHRVPRALARELGLHPLLARLLAMRGASDADAARRFLAGKLGDTAANLQEAIGGEHHETNAMYPEFAEQADADGNKEAAILFRMIARVEAEHRDRYKKLLEMVKTGTVFKREQPIKWKCGICGYIVEGTEPPPKCPSCKHPKEFYEPACMDF